MSQPFASGVQVVRGLVQQQQVGSAEQDPRQLQAAALTTRERSHMQGEPVLRQPEPRRDGAGLRFGLIPARIPIGLLRSREARHVGGCMILLEPEPRLLDPPCHLDEIAGGQDELEARDAVVLAMLPRVLAEIAQGTPSDGGPPRGGRLAGKHLEGAGLPGAVAAHDADLVPRSQAEAQVVDHGSAAGLDLQIADLEGAHRDAPGKRGWTVWG